MRDRVPFFRATVLVLLWAGWGAGTLCAQTAQCVLALAFAAGSNSFRAITSVANEAPADSNSVPLRLVCALNPDTLPVHDASGQTNSAMPVRGLLWTSGGLNGGGISLDGIGEYLMVGDAPSLAFSSAEGDRPFSIVLWAHMREPRQFPMVSKGRYREWHFGTDRDGRLSFSLAAGSERNMRVWLSDASLAVDERQWHQYAVTYDGRGANGAALLYRDGIPIVATCSNIGVYSAMPNARMPLFIGADGGASPGRGELDDLQVFRGVLTPDQVQRMYAQARAEATTGATFVAELATTLPGANEFRVAADGLWEELGAVRFDLAWPADAPTNAQVLVYCKDWDHLWYQSLMPGYLEPGQTNHFEVNLAADATGWEPGEHHGNWHYRVLADPREFGVRVFGETAWTGACVVAQAVGVRRVPDTALPFIRNVKASRDALPCFEKFELNFTLPDRYVDPFDTNAVNVTARFRGPDGRVADVNGFYLRDFYREIKETGERIVPQGPPHWCVRFAPPVPGHYEYTLHVRDACGEASWGPGAFDAGPAESHGFVRVSKKDPRFFEFDDGTPFFPIGHNIRSPFDDRMDGLFPWKQRWREGSSSYVRYFEQMQKHGETIVEVWFASWSFALEWTRRWNGYHGVGQYNLTHAWELDQVLEEARARGLSVNLVIRNHGQFSTWSDAEWADNPYNVDNGGYLERPDDYFTDPRAAADHLKLMRYITARWGYSRNVFAWELWSELDLTGSSGAHYKSPAVTAWHKSMSTAMKTLDPNRHMVTTHTCQDYSHHYAPIVELPEIDFIAGDAYHGKAEALWIVDLLRQTAQFGNPFGKPFLVTEFGGSPFATGIKHLEDALHAGLWSSPGIALGGSPMFWWWGLIEEEDFYPQFLAFSRFMAGEDRRDPQLQMIVPELAAGGVKTEAFAATCLRSPTRALGWVYRTADFARTDPLTAPAVSNVVMTIPGVSGGTFRVEFWDTLKGTPVGTKTVTAAQGELAIPVTPFVRDTAFKVNKAEGK